MWLAEGGDGEVSVVLVARGGEWSWTAEMRAPCGGIGGAKEGREECSEGRGEVGHDVWW